MPSGPRWRSTSRVSPRWDFTPSCWTARRPVAASRCSLPISGEPCTPSMAAPSTRSGSPSATRTGDLESEVVILAGGAWSGPLAATANLRVPVTPRQGMMVVTEPAPFHLRHVLKPIKSDTDMWRFSQPWPPDAPGKPGYDPNLPPGKGMGVAQTVTRNLVIGSTSRFVGLDRSPTLAGIRYVLESARRIAPAIGQLRMLRAWAGFRPYTPDGLPLLGPAPGVDGLVLATGHDGSGI